MKILFIIDSLGTGGAERSTSYLWYFLRERGIEFRILCLRIRKEGIQEEILKAGFSVEFLPKDSLLGHSKRISSIVKSFNPDIVHSILWKSNIRTRIARLLKKFFHVESLVNMTYSEARLRDSRVGGLKLRGYKLIDRLTGVVGVDHFHANGDSVARHYREHLNISENKITVVKRGRFRNPFVGEKEKYQDAMRRKYAIPHDALILINVGRHEFQKGQDLLLDALGKIRAQGEISFMLLIAGRDGNATKLIDSKIKFWSLTGQVVLLGHTGQVSELLAGADVFVFPSRFEGFPGSLIEAEAAALPVVCTDLPMMLEVVVPGVNAEVFKPESSEALAACIVRLAKDKQLRDRYASASLRQFNENFLIDIVHEKMLGMYNALIRRQ